jgi:hypothetical protein
MYIFFAQIKKALLGAFLIKNIPFLKVLCYDVVIAFNKED